MALALLALSIDCGDAGQLAAFWAAALGRPADPGATPESAAIAPSDSGATGPRQLFQKVVNSVRIHELMTTRPAEGAWRTAGHLCATTVGVGLPSMLAYGSGGRLAGDRGNLSDSGMKMVAGIQSAG
jgi:hypothetical protein